MVRAFWIALVLACACIVPLRAQEAAQPRSRLEADTEALIRKINTLAGDLRMEEPDLADKLERTLRETKGMHPSPRAFRIAKLVRVAPLDKVAKHREQIKEIQVAASRLRQLQSDLLLKRQTEQRERLEECFARCQATNEQVNSLAASGKELTESQSERLKTLAERHRTVAAQAINIALQFEAIIGEMIEQEVEYAGSDLLERLRKEVIDALQQVSAVSDNVADQLYRAAASEKRVEALAAVRKEQSDLTAKLRSVSHELQRLESFQQAIKLLYELGSSDPDESLFKLTERSARSASERFWKGKRRTNLAELLPILTAVAAFAVSLTA